jgi:glucose/arabinose dehydrogenase
MKTKFLIILIIVVALAAAGVYYFWPNLVTNLGPKPEAINLQLLADGFTAPTKLVESPDTTGRLFVAEQTGLVKIIKDGQVLEEPFLDLRSKMVQVRESYDERGLLGMAFSPNFTSDGKFYVYYSAPLRAGAPAGWDHTSHVSVFTVDKNNPDKIDLSSEKVLLEIDEPQLNHNGGEIIFGPDGNLYIGVGDGGNADDFGLGHNEEIGNGQDLNTLLGKILRIKPDGSVPPDNPFVGKDGRDEIYAYGFRNPFRMSFDKETGKLWVADVGQNLWEEVDIVEKGKNYGWNIKEGSHCFSHESPNNSPAECANTGYLGEELVGPILEYNHQQGISIIGGFVKNGKYIFGDWSMSFEAPGGKIMVAEEKDGKWQITQLKELNLYVMALGQDKNGELYVLTSQSAGPAGTGGQVWQIK